MSGRIYKVDELSKVINSAISSLFRGSVAVVGEVLNTSRSPAGHLYFSIKDTNSTINVVMFKNYAQLNSMVVKNGDQVVVYGELSTYQASSTYQLRAKRVVYERVGDFYKKFEEVKRILEAEGFFDTHRKRPINTYPQRIALITSPHGAALGDFIKVAKAAGGVFEADLYGVPVQGLGAEGHIATGIRNALARAKQQGYAYDAIVVMRGGGSQDDLAVFNSELIARAIHASGTPVISAIGHERDQTICDLVADVVASTPTDAATLIAAGYSAAGGKVSEMEQTLVKVVEQGVENRWQHLDYAYSTLSKGVSTQRINAHRSELEMLLTKVRTSMGYTFAEGVSNYENKITAIIGERVAKAKHTLNAHAQTVMVWQPQVKKYAQPLNYLGVSLHRSMANKGQQLQVHLNELGRSCSPSSLLNACRVAQNTLDESTTKFVRHMDNTHYSHKKSLAALTQLMNTHNPELLLQKGYSIVYHEGSVVEGLANIKPDTVINIQLKSGWVNARVEGVEEVSEESKPDGNTDEREHE